MKVRINKLLLNDLPPAIAKAVVEWQQEHHKAYIGIECASRFYVEPDAYFLAVNLLTGASVRVQAGGEWAGVTNLTPGGHCTLPPGNAVVATGYFCGSPWLTIYHNSESSQAAFERNSTTPAQGLTA